FAHDGSSPQRLRCNVSYSLSYGSRPPGASMRELPCCECTWPAAGAPITTSCFASSKVMRCPVCIAAIVMHSATEWLYPASMSALGLLRACTHSIQLRKLAAVASSGPEFSPSGDPLGVVAPAGEVERSDTGVFRSVRSTAEVGRSAASSLPG